MRSWAEALGTTALALLVPVIAGAGPLIVTHPADRFTPARFELEYLRPWAGLPVHQGRAAGSLPVFGPLWIGLGIGAMRTPTVAQTDLNLSARLGQVLGAEILRREIRVSGLEPVRRLAAVVDLRLCSGLWNLGVRTELEQGEFPSRDILVRREVWLGLTHEGGDFALSRITSPWSDEARLTAHLRLTLGRRVRLGMHWYEGGSRLSLGFGTGTLDCVSVTTWSGPQAGAVGIRVVEAP